MGQKEKAIERRILLELPENERLFRINAGMGWQGKIVKHDGSVIVLQNPRPFHGAPDGWPDLSGWRSVKITPDMVGKKIAVFYGVEIKAPSGGKKQAMRTSQNRFRKQLENDGGVYEIVES